MQKSKTPLRLWDLCASYVAEIRCLTAQPLFSLHARTPFEMVTGNTPDISEYIAFKWYQPVWYYDNSSFPDPTKHIARWIGVARNVGQAMCFWVLPASGIPIARSAVIAIEDVELRNPDIQTQLNEYDRIIEQKLGNDISLEEHLAFLVGTDEFTQALEDLEIPEMYDPVDPEGEKPDIDDYDEETYDRFTSAEVVLPKGDYQYIARVLGRKRDSTGQPIGRYNKNPILDTTIHEVEFPDGSIHEYAANVLAESLYSQVDQDGNRWLLLKDIIGHSKDKSAPSWEELELKRRRYTTKGWKLHCLWADGSTSWEDLRNLKESNPLDVTKYAELNGLLDEPAFTWWAKHVLKQSKRIIQKVKSRYWQRTHKYGVNLPKSVAEALQFDPENGNTLWHDAIQKELKNVQVAFKFLEEGEHAPVGYKEIPCHIIFDVKMNFTRKARFVAGGHKTNPPACLTYSSVVSRDSVRIAFLLAALNDLDILTADIGNAYINANVREKVFFRCRGRVW